jgi:arginyl-tRNA synthetase
MNIFETYEHLIRFELERMVSAGDLPAADFSRVSVDPPRVSGHGDLATNAALIAVPKAEQDNLAQMLAKHFACLHDVTNAAAADNGLVNLTLKPVVWHRAISSILHGTAGKDPCRGIIYDLAKDFSIDDPVFNLQHARTVCCAIMRHAQTALTQDISDNALASAHLTLLTGNIENALMRKITGWHHAMRGSAHARDVYAAELITLFRDLCAKQVGDAAMGFVMTHDSELSIARLALVRATAIVLAEIAP